MKYLLRVLFCFSCLIFICPLPYVEKTYAAQAGTAPLTESSFEENISGTETDTESETDKEQDRKELSAQWTPGEQTAVAIIAMLAGILVSYMIDHRRPGKTRGGKSGNKHAKRS